MARRPYTTRARLFRDSPLEVTLRWYRVPFENGPCPFETTINSLDQQFMPWAKVGVGEVANVPRPYDARRPPVVGRADHVCGTPEDFLLGCVYDPAAPPVEYTPEGIPACCVPGPTGVLVAGDAVRPVSAAGVLVGGVAPAPPVPTGGVLVGGASSPPVPTGGVLVGGEAMLGVPPPGADCAGAASIAAGVPYGYSLAAGEHWFALTAGSTGQWHLAADGVGTGDVNLDVFVGGVCPLPTPVAFAVTGPPCWEFTATAGDVIRLRFSWVAGTPTYSFTLDAGAC